MLLWLCFGLAIIRAKVQWTLTLLIAGFGLGFILSAREHVVRPLQTMTNLLAALREGDYSIRARGARVDDALGEALLEINALGETLRLQRLGAFEATALLRTIMAEIDVAVFTFDPERRLRLVNRAGEDLLGQPMDKLLGRRARDIGLEICLDANEDAPLTLTFPGGSGRWGVRRSSFRERGLPHELLVLTDLSRTLREEERNAWQRLVRVIGHEMNNSLAPIKSIAGSLETLIRRDPPPADWRDDARSGLNIIATRAESLSRFMQAYARLARLPPPQKESIDLGELVRRVASLETRLAVRVVPGPEVIIQADAAQLEQLLINILHNAAEASLETAGTSDNRLARYGGLRRSICARHGPRHHESDESVRSIFHDQTGWIRHWSGAEPANCGSAWRIIDSGESQRAGLRSALALAEVNGLRHPERSEAESKDPAELSLRQHHGIPRLRSE